MWSNRKTKRNGLVVLMAAAVLACASVTAAETGYHFISIPEGAHKVTETGVVLAGMKVLTPALDGQSKPVWDSDGDGAADGYTVTTLQAGGYTGIQTTDINESLDVVGFGRDANGNEAALLWRNVPDGAGNSYTLVELGHTFSADEMATFSSGWEVRAIGINDQGQVLIYEHGLKDISVLPENTDTFALAVLTPNGNKWFEDSDGNGDGFNDLMVELEHGTRLGGTLDGEGSINNQGQVAVWSNLTEELCVVVDGVRTVLQTDLGQPMAAIDISDSGLVLSGVHDHPRNYAVRWQIDAGGDVAMVGSEQIDMPVGVNGQGQAVGYLSKSRRKDPAATEYTTILWQQDGSTVNLADLLDNSGTAPNSLRPLDINDAGWITIAGGGGIAVPVGESPPPEPSDVDVTGMTPNAVQVGKSVSVTIIGSGFVAGATVTFVNGSGRAPTANVTSVSPTTIQATVTAHKKAKGGVVWDVRVANPDGSSGVLVDGLTVTSP